jgi:hypothetical protein
MSPVGFELTISAGEISKTFLMYIQHTVAKLMKDKVSIVIPIQWIYNSSSPSYTRFVNNFLYEGGKNLLNLLMQKELKLMLGCGQDSKKGLCDRKQTRENQ